VSDLVTIARRVERQLDRLPSGVTADVRITYTNYGTMRFANNRIHQPHLEEGTNLSVRICDEKRLATATSDIVTDEAIAALFARARSMAHVAPPEKKFPGFRDGHGRPPSPVSYSPATAAMAPERQARLAEEALRSAHALLPDARVSGVVNTGGREILVLNSRGVRRSTRQSTAQSSVLVEFPDRDPPASGWSEAAGWDAARLDTARLGREAAERVARGPPEVPEPGSYRVLLCGSAVYELMLFLSILGFGGKSHAEGWSCLRKLKGKAIAPRGLSIVDDPRLPLTVPQAIDYEGTIKKRRPLVDEGRVTGPVTDLVFSGRLGIPSTGHAQPPESPDGDWGPMPTQLAISAGDSSWDDLVRATKNGLLVTRFWYVRVVHPGLGILTGMTRDGTYRITNGEIGPAVRNLRFTESILTALKGVEAIGKERRAYSDERGGFVVTTPALVTKAFRFTSATLF
jgi:PmbA protein